MAQQLLLRGMIVRNQIKLGGKSIMKVRKVDKKLIFNKETIADLNKEDMNAVKGGTCTSLDKHCGSNCICMD